MMKAWSTFSLSGTQVTKQALCKAAPQGRFAFVDALRGIAAFVVVLFHALEGSHIPALEEAMPRWFKFLISHGNLGVAVFFVLSGFVISHSLYSERVKPSIAGRFMLRRSIRLDPPYWFAIAVAIAFALLSARVVPDKIATPISLAQILAHVFYVQDILGYPSINTVFWTLCLEVQFYLLYVAALALSRNDPNLPFQGRMTITVLGLAMLTSLLWPTGTVTTGLWPGSFLPLWHGFLIGVFAYWSWRNPALVPFFIATVGVILWFSIARGNAFSIACAATSCLLWIAAVTGVLSTGLSWPWLQFLGAISYSLYLIHNPITGASFRAGYMLTGHGIWWELFWWLASIAACIIFASAMWWSIERPSIRLGRLIRFRATSLPRSGDASST